MTNTVCGRGRSIYTGIHTLSVWGVSVRSRCEVSRSHCSLWTLANIDYKINMSISITITIIFFTVRKKKKKYKMNSY